VSEGITRSLFSSTSLRPRVVVISLLVIVALGGALRADSAAHPNTAYESPDERSYGLLSQSLTHGHYSQGARSDDLRWPPGAPALFAAAREAFPVSAVDRRPSDVPAAYWAQALVSTLTIALVFALASALGGPVAGLVAAALLAVYPPIITVNGAMLSEPLGAALATGTALLLVLALRAGSRRLIALAGGLFGLLVLTRADFLLALPVLGLAIGLLCRRQGVRAALLQSAAFATAGALVLAPWIIYASHRSGRLVPVTSGGGSALFVGTFLPGEGTTFGMKRALRPELHARHPRAPIVDGIPQVSAGLALDLVAERHPHVARDVALQAEGRHNLVKYGLGQPLAFLRMMAGKAARMWYSSYRGGGVPAVSFPVRIAHWIVIALGVAGFSALLLTRRLTAQFAVVLLLVAYTTLLHALFVSKARYNLPVMPMFVAAGVAGLATISWRRPRSDAR
jgi:4-amino-4-deoxy-L-arabinose transferase-like glycosyltransferase